MAKNKKSGILSKGFGSSLEELVAIDSPTGFTGRAAQYIQTACRDLGLKPILTRKGCVTCTIGATPPTVALTAHFDTLGAIIDEITKHGEIRVSQIGGYPPNSFEGSYVRIHTSDARTYTGTFLLDDPSDHANKEVGKKTRAMKEMHIRLDQPVRNKDDIFKLGIGVGDFVCFDPRYEITESGYIKSRFMDNKVGCYVLFEVARHLVTLAKRAPSVELFFSSYEEVGHGASTGFASSVEDLIVIDMGVVGDHVAGDELSVSICAKDTTGPYDYEVRQQLTRAARKGKIPHHVSVYPYYGSDGGAALRAGHDYRVGLIGPGVSASHGVERTHIQGVQATIDLCLEFLKQRKI